SNNKKLKNIFKKTLKENEFDLILSGPYTVSIAKRVGRNYKIPVGCFVRAFENYNTLNIKENIKNQIRKLFYGNNSKKTLNSIDFIVTNSKFMSSFCKKKGFSGSIEVIHPFINLDGISEIKETEIKRIAMVGTSAQKGVDITEKLSKEFPDLEFFILGYYGTLRKERNLNYLGWENVNNFFKTKADLVIV